MRGHIRPTTAKAPGQVMQRASTPSPSPSSRSNSHVSILPLSTRSSRDSKGLKIRWTAAPWGHATPAAMPTTLPGASALGSSMFCLGEEYINCGRPCYAMARVGPIQRRHEFLNKRQFRTSYSALHRDRKLLPSGWPSLLPPSSFVAAV